MGTGRALILGNNFCVPILRASGRLQSFSSTAPTCFYTKYRYNGTSCILLELIHYEGLEQKVFYLFTYIPYIILYVCNGEHLSV